MTILSEKLNDYIGKVADYVDKQIFNSNIPNSFSEKEIKNYRQSLR